MSLKKVSIPGRIRKIVEEQRESELSVASYCRKKKIPLSTFYYWRRRFNSNISSRRENIDSEFISVKIRNNEEKKLISADTITISFPTGMSMKVPCTSTIIKELISVVLKTGGII